MRLRQLIIICMMLTFSFSPLFAGNEVELKTTIIKGNNEAPQIFYMVPWQETSNNNKKQKEQKLVLHSLFGNLFDPILPEMINLEAANPQNSDN